MQEGVGLSGDNHTSDRGRSQGRKDTRNEGREGQSRDVATSLGGEFTEDTNLDTEGTNVTETAARVGSDELGSGGEVGVGGVRGEGRESNIFVLRDQRLVAMQGTKS